MPTARMKRYQAKLKANPALKAIVDARRRERDRARYHCDKERLNAYQRERYANNRKDPTFCDALRSRQRKAYRINKGIVATRQEGSRLGDSIIKVRPRNNRERAIAIGLI